MSGAADDQVDNSTVNITVLAVTPTRAGRLFALASVEIDIGGVAIELHGIRAMRVGIEGTRIELPQFRDAAGLPAPCRHLAVRKFTSRSATPCSKSWSSAA